MFIYKASQPERSIRVKINMLLKQAIFQIFGKMYCSLYSGMSVRFLLYIVLHLTKQSFFCQQGDLITNLTTLK